GDRVTVRDRLRRDDQVLVFGRDVEARARLGGGLQRLQPVTDRAVLRLRCVGPLRPEAVRALVVNDEPRLTEDIVGIVDERRQRERDAAAEEEQRRQREAVGAAKEPEHRRIQSTDGLERCQLGGTRFAFGSPMSRMTLPIVITTLLLAGACSQACGPHLPPTEAPASPDPTFEPLRAAIQSYVDRTQPYRREAAQAQESVPGKAEP